MKLPNWLRISWWILLLLGLTILLSQRYSAFTNGNVTFVDGLAFVIWAALLLAPLFQEISLWGVSFKGEIKELKQEVRSEVETLRTEIRNSIDMRTNISPNFYFPVPPPDTQLPKLEDQIRRGLEETFRERGVEPADTEVKSLTIPDDTVLLFRARYNIERELRRLYQQRFGGDDQRRIVPVYQMVRTLSDADLIDQRIAGAIREVYAVASPAIHGEDATPAQIRFVRDIAPEVVATLRAVL